MRLEPLYRIRFTYPESWAVGLDGGWQQLFFIAEGRCEGSITGRFRGANFPRKEGAEGPFRPDFRAVIEADDGAVIMVEWHGYGRAYPPGRRQIVGALFHLADREPYRRLNDAVLRVHRRGPHAQRSSPARTRSRHRCRRADLGAHRQLTPRQAAPPADARRNGRPPHRCQAQAGHPQGHRRKPGQPGLSCIVSRLMLKLASCRYPHRFAWGGERLCPGGMRVPGPRPSGAGLPAQRQGPRRRGPAQ